MAKISVYLKKRKEKKEKDKENFKYRYYAWNLEHSPLEEQLILLESQRGGSFGGNITAIAKELANNPLYADYQLVLSCSEEQLLKRREFLDTHGMKRIQLVSVQGEDYFRVLATAKYLVNDNTFAACFTKRPGQVYLNTWHGTPLKTLGKQIKEECGLIGNAQRNFFGADYLLCPNEFTLERLTEDYMLHHFGKTKLLLTGYPRNCIFSNKEKREQLRRECEFEQMQVFAYLPTWRGVTSGVQSAQQNRQLLAYFEELDQKLTDNQRVYVKLHPISVKAINLTGFQHIVPFPAEYEAYEFLNAMDGLITDYSSVFFDYAITGQKVILFTYDKEEYTRDRGFYFPLEELPFPQVDTVAELVEELNRGKNYDDTAFLDKFCHYDHTDITEVLCKKWIFGTESPLIVEKNLLDNKKKNVVLYAGSLSINRTTESFLELAKQFDTSNYNYMLLFRIEDMRYRQDVLQRLPKEMAHLGYFVYHGLSVHDMKKYECWKKHGWYPDVLVKKPVQRLIEMEKQRIFGTMRIDAVVDVTGYIEPLTMMLTRYPMLRVMLPSRTPQKGGLLEKKLAKKLVERVTTVEFTDVKQLEQMLNEI